MFTAQVFTRNLRSLEWANEVVPLSERSERVGMDPKRLVSPFIEVIGVLDEAITTGSIDNARNAIKTSEKRAAALKALDEKLGFRRPTTEIPNVQHPRFSA